MRHVAWGLAAAVVVLLGGCHGHLQRPPIQEQLTLPLGAVDVEFAERDRASKDRVLTAIAHATPELRDWGGLREPIHLYVLSDHDALEQAVGRYGYGWLKAWARYDEVFLQSPRTWAVFGASQSDIDELLLHELTHVVMYQQAADKEHWSRKGIPLWFREGMASVTANQGYRWPSLEDLARYYERHPDRDPLREPEPLYQTQSAVVYGAAHHAFAFLLHRYGKDRVREVLHQMSAGSAFPEAFERALGVSQQAFELDFRRYVRLRGFKGGRLMHPLPPLPPEISAQVHRLPQPTLAVQADGGTAETLDSGAPDAGVIDPALDGGS